MANLDFKSDLKLGNEGEKVVIEFLEKKWLTYVESNKDNKNHFKIIAHNTQYSVYYDYNKARMKELTYEVKTDVKCAPLFDTGNLFIEYSSRKKPSGIEVTQADWFVTYFQFLNELWFIKTEKLRELIKNNDFPVFKDAGDHGSETHGYLINRRKYFEHFYVTSI